VQFPKYPYSPQRRDWNFMGEGRIWRTRNLKKCMKLNWNFQRGWEVLAKSHPLGRYGYFLELLTIFWNKTINRCSK